MKKDRNTGKSRGFGFVRYGDRAVQASVFESSHTIKGRRVELKYPKQVHMVPHTHSMEEKKNRVFFLEGGGAFTPP